MENSTASPDSTPIEPQASSEVQVSASPSFSGSGDFSPDQVAQMASWMVESGTLDQNRANELLSANGLKPIAQAESLSPIAREIDSFFPPAAPEDFEFPPMLSNGHEITEGDKTLINAQNLTRTWLSEARFTKGIGNFIIQEAAKTEAQLKDMAKPERDLWAQSQRVEVERLLGQNQAAEKIKLANQLIFELEKKNPGLVSYLEQTGVGNSAAIVMQFAQQAERLYMRKG